MCKIEKRIRINLNPGEKAPASIVVDFRQESGDTNVEYIRRDKEWEDWLALGQPYS